ncbi:MAG: hypothetical protein HQL50_08695 [Magnetococcales bacterium]|nr:hypothetical protein [Magnetococcales bacterium]
MKLKRARLEKEHCDPDPVEVSLKVFRTLNRRAPIFYNREVEERFRLRLEEDRIKAKRR